ncbi:MAG: SET domain-containing protein-lysine N-methyltransferase [Acidobacteria bacterium]|nr:SET domain-containing protein-lysine N-methyltransferase [Acidobacteriota bacterium]
MSAKAAEAPRIDPRYSRFKLRVAPSAIHRWGVYAEEFIPKRRKVIEYTGEKLNRKQAKVREAEPGLHYLFILNPYWTIDGAVGGSGAQFVNHCCDPNLWAWITRDHILYMAARDIRPGEELTLDYMFDKDMERVECRCGAKSCRGTINLLE